MSDLVFVMPANDQPATTLAGWGAEVVRRARGAGHRIAQHLSGSAATPSAVQSVSAADAFVYFGHGTWDTLEGSQTLIDQTHAAAIRAPIAIAIACQSAHSLGSTVASANSGAYLGFDDDLLWLTSPVDAHRFQDAIVDGLDKLLSGGSASSVEAALRNELDQVFQHYKYNVSTSDPNRIWGYLAGAWDRDHVALVGTPTQALQSGPGATPPGASGTASRALHPADWGDMISARDALNAALEGHAEVPVWIEDETGHVLIEARQSAGEQARDEPADEETAGPPHFRPPRRFSI